MSNKRRPKIAQFQVRIPMHAGADLETLLRSLKEAVEPLNASLLSAVEVKLEKVETIYS